MCVICSRINQVSNMEETCDKNVKGVGGEYLKKKTYICGDMLIGLFSKREISCER